MYSKTVKFCKSGASKPHKHTLSHHFRGSEDAVMVITIRWPTALLIWPYFLRYNSTITFYRRAAILINKNKIPVSISGL